MPENRDEKGCFIKGCSGNRGGRPKVPENVREALKDMVPEAVAIKREILQDKSASPDLRNRVADSVLDRVYGRPAIMPDEGDKTSLERLDKLIAGIDNAAAKP